MPMTEYGQQRHIVGALAASTKSSIQNTNIGLKKFWLRGISASASGGAASIGSRITLDIAFYSMDTYGRLFGGSGLVTYGGWNYLNEVTLTFDDNKDGEMWRGHAAVSDLFVIDDDSASTEIHFTVYPNTRLGLLLTFQFDSDTLIDN